MRDILEELGEGNDPVRQVQKAMRKALPKRFYKQVGTGTSQNGFSVLLDGKPVQTPARNLLLLPNAAAARLVADEFDAQASEINPATMPLTRLANTVIDAIASDPQAVLEDIIRFAASDLLCYRAASPRELADLQAQAWDPVIDWMRERHGASFVLAQGVMHVAQPREALAVFGSLLRLHDEPFRLGCLHNFTSLSGSGLLAIAIARSHFSVEAAWNAATIDEQWNTRHWGEDGEAAIRSAARRIEFDAAGRFWNALTQK